MLDGVDKNLLRTQVSNLYAHMVLRPQCHHQLPLHPRQKSRRPHQDHYLQLVSLFASVFLFSLHDSYNHPQNHPLPATSLRPRHQSEHCHDLILVAGKRTRVRQGGLYAKASFYWASLLEHWQKQRRVRDRRAWLVRLRKSHGRGRQSRLQKSACLSHYVR